VIFQFYDHFGLEAAACRFYACFLAQGDKLFVQLLGDVGRARGVKSGPTPLAAVAVQGELRDNKEFAADIRSDKFILPWASGKMRKFTIFSTR
jgi:hypothetical protein